MSSMERFRALVHQHMNAAADDIGRILEDKMSEYEEEVRFLREENNSLQHKILQLASKSDVQIVVMDEDEANTSENQDESPEEDSEEDSSSSPICEEGQDKTAPKRTRRGGKSHTKRTEADTEAEGGKRKSSKRRVTQPNVSKAKRSKK